MRHRTLQLSGTVRWLVIAGLLFFVIGCSTRFIYERIDWLVVWRIGGYVTLHPEQKAALKQDVQQHLDHVRVNQMPAAATMLSSIAREVEAGVITPEGIEARYQQLLAQFDAFMLGIVPPAMNFLRSLDEEQVQELFANLEEINGEMYDEYSGRTPEEREKNRNKSAIKSTQEWTGRLDDGQKQLLKDALAEMDDASEQWIEYQREWQQRFRTLIETRPPEEAYQQELINLFVYPRDFHSDVYRSKVDTNRGILNTALADLLTNLTAKQRRRAVKKLDGYADDLQRLSAGD
jgi:hypothetical protein